MDVSPATGCRRPRGTLGPRAHPPPPLFQVTGSTFDAALPALRAALATCDFIALDLEFTGVEPGPPPGAAADDGDRYESLRAAASRFVVTQVGLAVCSWGTDCGSEGGPGWSARCFNVPVFPHPAGDRPEFTAATSSLAFLSTCNFDFNSWIRDGVPFATAAWRDGALARAAAAGDRARDDARPPIVPEREEDKALVEGVKRDVAAWLARGDETGDAATALELPAGDAATTLELPAGNAFQRALTYQTLRDVYGDDPPFVATTARPADAPRARRAPVSLTRAPPGGAAAAATARAAEWEADIRATAGFVAAFEAVRDAGAPVVVHNGGGDVAHCLAAFAGRLPPSLPAFKAMVDVWFPGGVYDTKAMAEAAPHGDGGRRGGGGTSLRAVFDSVVEAGDAVTPTLAPGCERYAVALASAAGTDAGEHEAGFDALLTAVAFAGLAARGVAVRDPAPAPAEPRSPRELVAALAAPRAPRPPQPRIDFDAVADFRGLVYTNGVSPPWASVSAGAPDPGRADAHILTILPLPPSLDARSLHAVACRASGSRRVRVSLRLGGAAASVELFEAAEQGRSGGREAVVAATELVAAALAAAPELSGTTAVAVLTASALAEWRAGRDDAAGDAAAARAALAARADDAASGRKRRRTDDGETQGRGKACAVM